MSVDLQRFFALIVGVKAIDLLLRGMPLPMVIAMGAGTALLLARTYPQVGAGIVSMTLAALPWVSDFSLYSNHIWLMTLIAALIASRAPAWLFCANVAIVYGFSAVAKIQPEYLSGWPIATSFSPSPIGVIALSVLPLWILIWGSILAEAFLAVALWFRATRPVAAMVGVGLHGGMIAFMSANILVASQFVLFAALMFSAYPIFFRNDRVTVVWDDSCSFCSRWIYWFRRLDWNRTLAILPLSQPGTYRALGINPDRAAFALQAIDHSGISEGYDAVTTTAASLPLFAPIVPLLRLPPTRWAGQRIYRHVALRRTCQMPVTQRPQLVPNGRRDV